MTTGVTPAANSMGLVFQEKTWEEPGAGTGEAEAVNWCWERVAGVGSGKRKPGAFHGEWSRGVNAWRLSETEQE